MRLWECSLAACIGRGDDPQGNSYVQNCVHDEVKTKDAGLGFGRPASLLRFDLPAAIFAGGRCVSPANFEWESFPKPVLNGLLDENGWQRVQDDNGYQREGFVGHNTTQMGVGWILHDPPRELRGAAFAHDAWTQFSHKSGTHLGGKLKSCKGHRKKPVLYAKARLAAMHSAISPSSRFSNLSMPQRRAAAYKWNFANSSYNCWHWGWNDALAQQRRYTTMLAHEHARRINATRTARQSNGTGALAGPSQPDPWSGQPECSIWGSLYNQMHVGWNESLIQAIFYVNDTHTARHIGHKRSGGVPLGAVRRRELEVQLVQHALAVAQRARAVALLAQHVVQKRFHLFLPIVQYVGNDECYRPERPAGRVRRTMNVTALSVSHVEFHGHIRHHIPRAKIAQEAVQSLFRVIGA